MNDTSNMPKSLLAITIKRTADEAMCLRTLSLNIEKAMSGVIASKSGELDADYFRILQNLDLLSQSAEALSDFLLKLSEKIPEDVHLDLNEAFDAPKLEQVRNRLLGANPTPNQNPQRSQIDIF